MSGTPPAASRAWTWAEIQERLRMSVRHSAKIHPDQGKQATNRYAGVLLPLTGSRSVAVRPAQSTSIVLPGSWTIRATRSCSRAYSPTLLQNPEYP